MTSFDSGVETGNDSNDSYATFESQPKLQEVSPAKLLTFSYSSSQSEVNTSGMDKPPSITKEADVGDSNECDDPEFRQPMQKSTSSDFKDLDVEPPAGISFCNVQNCLGINGYEVRGVVSCKFNPTHLQRKIRVFHNRLKNHRDTWYQFKGPLDERRLRQAAATNNADQVAALLNSGVDPNSCDDQQRSPLHLAACRGYCDVVRLLLERGADPNRTDSLGNTPLHLAACTNNVGVVTLLLKAGTDVSCNDLFGRSPLQLAQSKLRLLQRGAANTDDSNLVKEEVRQVIEMMLAYLHKRGQEIEAELVGAFTSRLTLSQTREEVETDVRDLLASLSNLSLNKTAADQATCSQSS